MKKDVKPAPSDSLLLNSRDVATELRLSQGALWKLVSAGLFPKPIRLAGACRWRRADVENFIAGLADGAKADAALSNEQKGASDGRTFNA